MRQHNEPLNIKAKYKLELHSHSKRKLLQESLQLLKVLYPFEVDQDKVSVRKINEKGLYEVCIHDNYVTRKIKIKFVIIFALISALILFFSIVSVYKFTEKKQQILLLEEEKEKQNKEKIQLQQEKEKEVKNLESEYRNLMLKTYDPVYKRILNLNNTLITNSIIDNLTIDGKTFSIDVETKDAVQSLSNFENSHAFSSVKMVRTTLVDNKDIVTFTGEFTKFIPELDESLSLDDKIEFYQSEIDRLLVKDKNRLTLLSDYIKYIRTILKKTGCNEQYIQLKGSKENVEIECFVYSTSKSVLSFIEEIQNQDDYLFDISVFKLRNSTDQNKLQTIITFVTGIEIKENNTDDSDLNNLVNINIDELEKMFTKKDVTKKSVTPQYLRKSTAVTNAPIVKITPQVNNEQLPMLSYIGITKKNEVAYVLAKDNIFGTFYTIRLVDTEIEDDCCIQISSGYKAKIDNKYYEVKK